MSGNLSLLILLLSLIPFLSAVALLIYELCTFDIFPWSKRRNEWPWNVARKRRR
jgi:hypothetical protein